MANKINFERSITTENPMTRAEVHSADQVLARLVAAAYAADHPELFGGRPYDTHIMEEPSHEVSRPSFCRPENEGIPTAGENDVRVD